MIIRKVFLSTKTSIIYDIQIFFVRKLKRIEKTIIRIHHQCIIIIIIQIKILLHTYKSDNNNTQYITNNKKWQN